MGFLDPDRAKNVFQERKLIQWKSWGKENPSDPVNNHHQIKSGEGGGYGASWLGLIMLVWCCLVHALAVKAGAGKQPTQQHDSLMKDSVVGLLSAPPPLALTSPLFSALPSYSRNHVFYLQPLPPRSHSCLFASPIRPLMAMAAFLTSK